MPTAIKSRPLNRALDVSDIEIRKGDAGPHRVSFSASSGAPVKRLFGTEILDHSGVRLDRVRAGAAPLLFNHDWDRPIGMLDTARVQEGRLLVDAHFFDTADAAEVRTMIDGGLRNISIGYRLHKVEKRDDGAYIVRDFEIYEVSVVTVPADASVGIGRAAEREELPIEVINFTGGSNVDEEEKRRLAEEARQAERTRIADIRNRCRVAKLGEDFAQRLIDEGVHGDAIAARILDAMATRQEQTPTRSQHSAGLEDDSLELSLQARERGDEDADGWPVRLGYGSGEIRALKDMRAGMIDRVVAMQCGRVDKPSVAARDFERKRIVDMARDWLAATTGRSVASLERQNRFAIVSEAFGTRGGHSTSDFPNLLISGTQRSLRQLYEMKPATFWPFVKRVTLPDLRAVDRIAFSNMGSLQKVPEGGEYNYGTFQEGKVSYSMGKYGGGAKFTWEAIVNDDLGAFERLPRHINQMVIQLQSKMVYDLFAANSGTGPVMPDSYALFSTQHANNQATAAAFTPDSLSTGRVLMETKPDLSGKDYMQLEPEFLLVHSSRRTLAEQYLAQGTILQTTDRQSPANKWYSALQLIADPRLPANQYVLVAPQVDTIEFAELEGETAPFIEQEKGFDVDEWKLKVRYCCGAAVIDHFGFVRHVLT